MSVTNCVAEALPDLETLTWLERRLPLAGWRVRSFILERLAGLARVDAGRTARLFRVVIGLSEKYGEPCIEAARWDSPISDHAVDTSLAGDGPSPGLLVEFPVAFFPVALDLAQALLTYKRIRDAGTHATLDKIKKSVDLSSDAEDESTEVPGSLIDDQPRWTYWSSLPAGDARHRCLRAIHGKGKEVLQSNPALFYSSVAPLLRRSPLATVQSFALDLLLDQKTDARSLALLRDAALDARLYVISDADYWLQQLLITTWPSLEGAERESIQGIIAVLLADEQTMRRAKRLLACLPATELRADLAAQRPSENAPESKASSRPRREEDDDDNPFALIPETAPKKAPGTWPEHFDRAALLQFHNSSDVVRKSDALIESIRAELPNAVSSALSLAPLLRSDLATLNDDDNAWIWDAFEKTLAAYHKIREQPDRPVPPPELVRLAAELGLAVLKDLPADLPGKLPDGSVWMGFRETSWTHALDLVDEALVWEPMQNDNAVQSEFISLIKRAFATGAPLLQLVCATRIRPFHWLRNPERRELFRQLVWESPSDPRILEWSVNTAAKASDHERTEIFRLALSRGDLPQAKELAGRIGNVIGVCSILVLDTGRSSAAALTREIVAEPSRFALLREGENVCEFWHNFAFGLKERAMHTPALSHLALDYGHWMQAAWKAMRQHQTKNRSEAIILFATHWMERPDGKDAQLLLPWWESVQPLLADVISEGSAADCFNIFFNFRDGPFNHLAKPEELLGFVGRFADRVIIAANSNQVDLDARNAAGDEHHSWRECASYAAQAVDSLNQGGLLHTDLQRDHAHRVLSRLAAPPIRSPHASTALHSLQRD